MQDGEFVGRQTMESELKAYLWPVDGTPAPAPPSRWRRFIDRHLPSVVIYLMIATLVGVVLYPHMVVTVPSGEVGVLWKRFGGGTVLDPRRLKNEGFKRAGKLRGLAVTSAMRSEALPDLPTVGES